MTARCKSATVLHLDGSMMRAIDDEPSKRDVGLNHFANSCHARNPAPKSTRKILLMSVATPQWSS